MTNLYKIPEIQLQYTTVVFNHSKMTPEQDRQFWDFIKQGWGQEFVKTMERGDKLEGETDDQ